MVQIRICTKALSFRERWRGAPPHPSLSPKRKGYAAAPGCILMGAVVAAPPLPVFAPHGLAPLLALAAVALIAADPRACLLGARRFWPLAAMLAALALWGAASALWSPIPADSFLEGGRLLALSAAGLVVLGAAASLAETAARRLAYAIIAGRGAGDPAAAARAGKGDSETLGAQISASGRLNKFQRLHRCLIRKSFGAKRRSFERPACDIAICIASKLARGARGSVIMTASSVAPPAAVMASARSRTTGRPAQLPLSAGSMTATTVTPARAAHVMAITARWLPPTSATRRQ
jgi:hypothetical protein